MLKLGKRFFFFFIDVINIQIFFLFSSKRNPNNGPHKIQIGWPQFNNRSFPKIRITQNMGASSIESESEEKRNLYKFFNDDLYLKPKSTQTQSTSTINRREEVDKSNI